MEMFFWPQHFIFIYLVYLLGTMKINIVKSHTEIIATASFHLLSLLNDRLILHAILMNIEDEREKKEKKYIFSVALLAASCSSRPCCVFE